MTHLAITVKNLSKAYHIGLKQEIPDTFMGSLTNWTKSPLRNWKRLKKLNTFNKKFSESDGQKHEDDIFWALRDVSFDIKQGEVVGIIGRNGAGKSTLLKVLSKITEPTQGRVTLRGRISSLLEVGTGFHPELTGRENVYLNGTILGMTKREIDRKFDEIVDFSGVEKFLDTPIKRYSSGMKVRLAFAVAAHLEPEILIIDEVLAVGDAEFQAKCLGKMQDVSQSGRTVLFVSHNAGALRALCQRGILLEGGKATLDGPLATVLDSYLEDLHDVNVTTPLANRTDRKGLGEVQIRHIEVLEEGQAISRGVMVGRQVSFVVRTSRVVNSLHCALRVYDSRGNFVVHWDSLLHSAQDQMPPCETDLITCEIEELLLMPGKYRIDAELYSAGSRQDQISSALRLEVLDGRIRGRALKNSGNRPLVGHPHQWKYPSIVSNYGVNA